MIDHVHWPNLGLKATLSSVRRVADEGQRTHHSVTWTRTPGRGRSGGSSSGPQHLSQQRDQWSGHLTDAAQDMNGSIDNTTSFNSTLPPAVFIPCHNPRNVIGPNTAEMVELLLYVGILPVLVICGITFNVISMAVFARQGLRDRFNFCLFCLTASDTGVLLTSMCGKSFAIIRLLDREAGNYWFQRHIVICHHLAFLGVSNTITALTAIGRCLCILHPDKAARFFRMKYIMVVILATSVYILSVKYVVLIIKYQVVQVTDPQTNRSTYINRLSPTYMYHRTLFDMFHLYLLSVALPCISLIIVLLCTAAIILRVRSVSTWRRKSVGSRARRKRQEGVLRQMLVTVCCVDGCCIIPSVTRVILLSSLPGFLSTGYLCNLYRVATAVCTLFESLLAAVSYFIYVKQSSQFRTTLHNIRCCRFWTAHITIDPPSPITTEAMKTVERTTERITDVKMPHLLFPPPPSATASFNSSYVYSLLLFPFLHYSRRVKEETHISLSRGEIGTLEEFAANKRSRPVTFKTSVYSVHKNQEIINSIHRNQEIDNSTPRNQEIDNTIPRNQEIDNSIPRNQEIDNSIPRNQE